MMPKLFRLLIMVIFTATLGVFTTFAQDFQESPMLAAQVDPGTLPAIADRLPPIPL